jgi:hypothetical protein
MHIMKITAVNSYKSRMLIIVLLLLLVPITDIFSQNQRRREEPPPIRERIFFGGNLGLQFGTITNVQISPIVGLWVLPRVIVAGGPNFTYYQDPYDKTMIYGGKFYSEFFLIRDLSQVLPLGGQTGIFLHLEDEVLSLESDYWGNQSTTAERFTINTVLAGGGISQQIGSRSYINFMVLWALNESIYTVYSNPEIRVSFSF